MKLKKIKQSLETGLSFGLVSGIITTLGLIVGLNSGTHSKLVVLGGIMVVVIADGLSDSLGIHISETSDEKRTEKEIWQSTLATLFSKLLVAATFVIPIYFLKLNLAILVSIIWGLSLIGLFSYYLAKVQNQSPVKVIMEHLLISGVVILATYFVGQWSSTLPV